MIDTGDTAFIILCGVLVFLMTPGLAFFYGGMVRRKNTLNTMMSVLFVCGLASVMWIAFGYSLAFGEDHGGFIGSLNHLFFNGVTGSPNPTYSETIPETLFASFQMMFSIITPALIYGAVAERMKFSTLFVFIAIWLIIVYYPMAHMVWGSGGFLAELGSVDFAGGNVVHISSGITGLVLALFLGKRRDYGRLNYRPHNIPFVVLGASLLWFGWFGFNAGSALGANALAVHALLTTNTAAATAMLSWMLVEQVTQGKPTVMGAITGAVVGLVAITPGAGFVPLWSAFIIGGVVSPLCFFFISKLKHKWGLDDSLDAFGCHGLGGIWGGIATGIFAKKSINGVAQWDGLFYGETRLFVAQIISIVITIAFSAIATGLILLILKQFMPLRVEDKEEVLGLDLAEHDETAYPTFMGMDS
ncbi:ammonium transporter [Carnobacterium maltaromaticum]|jgi:Amt family ammonium transporter|uniref:ammonium transporter n=1 Tax=Carnobacterium maltaromaticum TaxID=2751 RepID=UPI000E7122E5|nr:ammonium transporter [Carnobacterium maltaromaticum]AOA02493.1 ammonia permease [Carnobacterium maltaromaticum]